MSERNNDEIPNVVGPKSAVFKSADHGPTKMNSMTNSAVSDVAVERLAEAITPADSEAVEIERAAAMAPVAESEAAAVLVTQAPEEIAAAAAAKAAEDIAASMAKVDAAVQSIEDRQAEISESFHKAEELLAEVTRVRDALTFNDDLRKRIERTVSRTRTLRGNVSK